MRYDVMICCLAASTLSFEARAEATDCRKIDTAFHRPSVSTGGACRYAVPRGDLSVTVDGVKIAPGLALGGWIAFAPAHDSYMAMGDLVLTEDEIAPAIDALTRGGVAITALHHHVLRVKPAIFYAHVMGMGEPERLAETFAAATRAAPPPAAAPAQIPALDLDTSRIDAIIGAKGRDAGGVYQFALPRADALSLDGTALTGALGAANVVNFQPTGSGNALVAGDFMALAGEVAPLVETLRAHRVEVAAIHNHMLTEQPRMFFIHFQAQDDALALARALRAALTVVRAAPTQ